MNILFINPSTSGYTRSVSAPLGLLSIATFLKSKGYSVRIYDRTVDKTKLETVLTEFPPDVAGISLISYKSINDTLSVAEELKQKGVPVIAGGPLASALVRQTLAHNCFDAVSVGEGEMTWLDLAEYYEGKFSSLIEIPGLAYKNKDGDVVYTQARPFADLSELPALDWSLIDVPKYFQSSYGCKKMLYLYSAKGCPFNCTFCYNKDFHKCRYRKKPLEILLDEIRFLVTNHGMDGVYFADEMWCRNTEEMHEICDSLKNLGLDFVWGCQTRIGIFNEEDFRYMYNSGCRWIFFGIESGSKKILSQINKKIDYDKIVSTFSDCRKAKIACIGSFITAFPDETEEDLADTVRLIQKLETSLININNLALIPGSDIYNTLTAKGLHKEADTLEEFGKQKHMERLEYNYSKIPDLDINVVKAYFMWKSFTAEDVPGTKKHDFTKKVIADALMSVKTGDLPSFILSTYIAGVEFLKALYYSHFFPEIMKKYGLKQHLREN